MERDDLLVVEAENAALATPSRADERRLSDRATFSAVAKRHTRTGTMIARKSHDRAARDAPKRTTPRVLACPWHGVTIKNDLMIAEFSGVIEVLHPRALNRPSELRDQPYA